jgi:hypothetical protein
MEAGGAGAKLASHHPALVAFIGVIDGEHEGLLPEPLSEHLDVFQIIHREFEMSRG